MKQTTFTKGQYKSKKTHKPWKVPKLNKDEKYAWWQHFEQERELLRLQRKPEE